MGYPFGPPVRVFLCFPFSSQYDRLKKIQFFSSEDKQKERDNKSEYARASVSPALK